MSVLLGRDTRLIVQGMGREGTFHATRMREYGTKVVLETVFESYRIDGDGDGAWVDFAMPLQAGSDR